MRRLFLALAALAATTSAQASGLTIPLASGVAIEHTQAVYQCPDGDIPVSYINAGSIALAVLEIDGQQIVAANVLSASGARFAGAQYIWWTKGDEAMLYDIMEGGEDAPVATCMQRD
jgi:membrane-bound inhibitor of C-type lysozyme